MRDVGVGRVLVASLHQGIADVLPMRLGFYENWLNEEGLRDGTIGIAPLSAVLSFLRQEGDPYDRIMATAGAYAADWTVESLTPPARKMISTAPAWLRSRMLLRLAGRIVRQSYQGTRASSTVRKGLARVELRGSIFCGVREPVGRPLCGFYAAVFSRVMLLFDVPHVIAEVTDCRGTHASGGVCVLSLTLRPVVSDASEGVR